MILKKSLTLRNIFAAKIFRLSPLLFFQSLPSIHLPFPPFSFKLLIANSTKRRAKESREARYKTASNGIKSRYLKDLHCLTSAATTFMTIFIVFLPRHYRVSSRLCSPTIKKATPKNLSTRGRA